jgi:hypothetical protein
MIAGKGHCLVTIFFKRSSLIILNGLSFIETWTLVSKFWDNIILTVWFGLIFPVDVHWMVGKIKCLWIAGEIL